MLAESAALLATVLSTFVWTDASRPTPANGRAPARPARTFKTDITYPSVGPGSGRLPLLVFVHGVGANRREYRYLTRWLAGEGYVVVAADFPLTAASTKGGATDAHSDEQVRDLSFLVDRFTDPANAQTPWARLADASRYVVVGIRPAARSRCSRDSRRTIMTRASWA